MQKKCEHCQRLFKPRANVPDQKYCANHECQKARRYNWRRQKLTSDPDYRANQADAQKRWSQRNRDYWKRYRRSHPSYANRNRKLQKDRNARRNSSNHQPSGCKMIAKSDASEMSHPVKSGYYKLVPLEPEFIAKSDALVVQLTVIMDEN